MTVIRHSAQSALYTVITSDIYITHIHKFNTFRSCEHFKAKTYKYQLEGCSSTDYVATMFIMLTLYGH